MTIKDWWSLAKKAWGKVRIKDVKTDTEVYYDYVGKDTLNISFRSTDMRFIDWLYNFIFFFKDAPFSGKNNIKCHHGFLVKYEAVRSAVQNLVIEGIKNINITGISQGAAVALICGVDIFEKFKIVPAVRTFCTPKVFNREGSLYFSAVMTDTIIYNSANDLVGKVPPQILGFYHPIENLRFIDNVIPFGIFKPWIYHQPDYYTKIMLN